MSGWIKLHRTLIDWEWYDDHNATRLLVHLLLSVNYEDKKWKGILVKAGSRITSFQKLADETGLTVKQIRCALFKLENSGEVARIRAREGQSISLVKWEKMQNNEPEEGKQQGRPRADRGQTEGRPRATTKEVKNLRSKEFKKQEEEKEKEVDSTPSENPKASANFQAQLFLLQIGVEKQHAIDFLKNRKNKKLANTETSFRSILTEINKTGQTPDEIIKICAANGWGSFKNSWNWKETAPQTKNKYQETDDLMEEIRQKYAGNSEI